PNLVSRSVPPAATQHRRRRPSATSSGTASFGTVNGGHTGAATAVHEKYPDRESRKEHASGGGPFRERLTKLRSGARISIHGFTPVCGLQSRRALPGCS